MRVMLIFSVDSKPIFTLDVFVDDIYDDNLFIERKMVVKISQFISSKY